MAILCNIGCKLNQYEGYCLYEKFRAECDVVIVNTCCVTYEAEIKSLKKLRQAKRLFPSHKIIVTGCLTQLRPEIFNEYSIINLEERNNITKETFPLPAKSRYFLKIEDGCNQSCTFCVVSRLRKNIQSKPLEKVKQEIIWAYDNKFKEIVLVGANIGLYGMDIDTSLIELFKAIAKMQNLPRIRLSSLEPKFLNLELIAALKDLPFCRHFHIPVQSGDDKILQLMGRSYNKQDLHNIFELITRNFSDVAIGADIIVGFPGEAESEFNNTFELIKSSPLTHLHIFPYSPRPITPIYKVGDSVSLREKKKRLWALKELIAEKNYQFRSSMVEKTLAVIIEKKNGLTKGLTDNYLRVNIDKPCPERNLINVKITRVTKKEIFGVVA
ncbi:MAG: MiaB/RimO family radical SAM methylthiotransferase [bacterium]